MVIQVIQSIDALQTRVKQHHIWSKNTELPNGPPPVCLTSILHVCLSECLLYVQCIHHPDIITYSALTLLVWKWLAGWSSGVDGGVLEINRDGSDQIQSAGSRPAQPLELHVLFNVQSTFGRRAVVEPLALYIDEYDYCKRLESLHVTDSSDLEKIQIKDQLLVPFPRTKCQRVLLFLYAYCQSNL